MTIEVIDKYGKRVRRDGIMQDGDHLTVPLRMMDAAHPGLAAAAALAETIKRVEAFDASHGVGHRPGFLPVKDAGAGNAAREQYHARTRDAWRNPSPVLDNDKARKPAATVLPTASNEQLFAARDQAIADRDKRLEAAWAKP